MWEGASAPPQGRADFDARLFLISGRGTCLHKAAGKVQPGLMVFEARQARAWRAKTGLHGIACVGGAVASRQRPGRADFEAAVGVQPGERVSFAAGELAKAGLRSSQLRS